MQEYKYTYSFIIPHHNSPELLNRCLDSIPQREDIQIIVVDDNSTEDKRPCITRNDVEVIYIDAEHTKGAGRARNYGLKAAKGKWLLFADCDDFYNKGFIEVLDQYKDKNLDMLFFSCNSADSDTMERIESRGGALHKIILQAMTGDEQAIAKMKYGFRSPWYKMVSHALVKKYSITFEEVKSGNDTMFSFNTCYHCERYEITPDQLYCVTYRQGSITYSKRTMLDYYVQISGLLKRNAFYDALGLKCLKRPLWKFLIKGIDNPQKNSTRFENVKNHILFFIKGGVAILSYNYKIYKQIPKYKIMIIK